MRLKIVLPVLAALALLGLAACSAAGSGAEAGSAPAASATGREWRLVELGGRPAAMGAGGRPATLRLEAGRASGFAGCNTFSSGYLMSANNLAMTSLASTRMACAEGMELERAYLAALDETLSYRVTTQGLELLSGDRRVLARFTAAP
ncbi:MAG: META domain-containing protein [Longimicrobiaceae bacterium]